MQVDPKRTVKATLISHPDGWDDFGEPGACLDKSGNENFQNSLLFHCPGCGRFGSIEVKHPKEQHSWDLVSGNLSDPTTLTLSPSIHCIGCCGWHGYLKNGVFESC